MGTYWPKERRGKIRWHVLDAGERTLGRLAARAALVLMGKHCPDYSPHLDHREGVIVLNADKVRLTGRKLDQKFYRQYSGYPGGLKETSARDLLARQPEKAIREAIVGHASQDADGSTVGHARAGLRRGHASPCRPDAGATFP